MPCLTSQFFGTIEYMENEVVNFVRPILGFDQLTKFIVVSSPESEPLKWLLSIENPKISFVILEPQWVLQSYEIEISQHDIRALGGSENKEDYQAYLIITVPKGKPEEISANLKGPIVINRKNLNAIQMVSSNPNYDIQYSFMKKHGAITGNRAPDAR